MAAEIIVTGAVGTATLWWSWRGIKWMRAYWRYHKQGEQFERGFREAREEMSVEDPFRVPTAADGDLVALLGVVVADERVLEASGFTVLGDLVIRADERPTRAVMRVLVDRSKTTCAVLAVACNSPLIAHLGFASYGPEDMFRTRRGLQAGLADPPFVHAQNLAADQPIDTLIRQHRAFAVVVDPAKAFTRIDSRDQLIAEFVRFRAKTLRWRADQAPDVLFDADLRTVLGEHYNRVGKIWSRRLRAELPRATIRRV